MSARPIEVVAGHDGGAQRFYDSCLVVIPAANQEKTIFRVVSELRDRGFKYIRVIDTGSVDSTALRARAAGAEVPASSHVDSGGAVHAAWTRFLTGSLGFYSAMVTAPMIQVIWRRCWPRQKMLTWS